MEPLAAAARICVKGGVTVTKEFRSTADFSTLDAFLQEEGSREAF